MDLHLSGRSRPYGPARNWFRGPFSGKLSGMKVKKHYLSWAGFLLTCLLTDTGCWVRKETGEQMQAEISALQAELAVLKKFNEEQKLELAKRIQEADERIAELVNIIDDYHRAMGRNAADIGVAIDQLRERISALVGRIEVLEYALGKLQKAASAPPSSPATQAEAPVTPAPEPPKKIDPLAGIQRPEKKEDFYKLAHSLLENGQPTAARMLFEEFLQRWPKDQLAANSQYWIAESHYVEKDFRRAALAFQQVRTNFPKSDKAGDALVKMGFCFFSMQRYQEAIPFLEQYLQDFPRGSQVAAAKEKLRQAQKLAKKKPG